LLCIFFVLEEK